MKLITAKLSVLAMVCGVSMALGCSSEDPSKTGGGDGTEGVTEESPQKLSTLKGKVGNDGDNMTAVGLGGDGTIEKTASVVASQIMAGGELKKLAEGTLDAAGGYSLQVPSGIQLVIVQCKDSAGNILASVALDSTAAAAGGLVEAAKTTAETSVEAMVITDIATKALADLDLYTQVHEYIDGQVATALGAAAGAGGDVKVLIGACADAIVIAKDALLQALLAAGINVSAKALAAIESEVNASLVAALNAGTSIEKAAADAEGQLYAKLNAQLGVTAQLFVQAKAVAAAIFAAEVNAILTGKDNAQALIDACVKAALELEAQAVSTAVVELVKASGAAQATVNLFLSLCEKYVADVKAAASLEGVAKAKGELLEKLKGTLMVEGALAALIAAQGGVQAAVQSTVESVTATTVKLTADVNAKLNEYVAAAAKGGGSAEADAALKSLLQVYEDFSDQVHANVEKLKLAGATGLEVDLVAKVLTVVETAESSCQCKP